VNPGAAIVGVVIGLALVTVWMRWWMKNAFASTPKGVLRHLRKTGSVHLRHIRGFEAIWDPSRPLGFDNRLHGPGEATCSIDDAATVTLEFRAKDGQTKRFSGPIPETLTHPSERVLRARKLIRYALVGYSAIMIVRGQFPVRGFGHQMSAPLAVMFNSR
jgi:hypothetical protein